MDTGSLHAIEKGGKGPDPLFHAVASPSNLEDLTGLKHLETKVLGNLRKELFKFIQVTIPGMAEACPFSI